MTIRTCSNYSRGAFQPIDEDVLKTYAPTFYEKTKDLEEYTKVDDQRYFLAATRPLAYNWVTLIRTDWLEKQDFQCRQIKRNM